MNQSANQYFMVHVMETGFVAITQLTFECEVFQLLKEVSTLSVLNAGSKAMQVFIANCERTKIFGFGICASTCRPL